MAGAPPPVFNPIQDLKAIALILTCAWFIWFWNGGPQKYEASQQKPFLMKPTEIVVNDIWQDPFISEQYGGIPNATVNGSVNVNLGNSQVPSLGGGTVSVGSGMKKYGLFGKPVSYVNKGKADSSGKSYIQIDYQSFNKASLNFTGLTLRDFFGKRITVGQASLLPYQGRVNPLSDIIVYPGSTVYFIEGQSPIGVSFRVNKCIGTLAQFQNYYPPLPPPILGLNYNDCVDAHKLDTDFYHNDWRIYLGNQAKPWLETGDLVRLEDSDGVTLASLFY